ncbi:two-component system sensor histidine kinase PilS [Pseudomonas aeruginosa]|uniref:two-component system sensor histidine kinase PilS n=1 Tax=Pseudomonas aeruginosa TaxID=287 RepID=UPI001C0F9058|nr:PAS domain-containing sensor histidine kinase [Pseudomonas aeruginosa]
MRAERLRLSEEQGQRILRLYHLYRLTIGLVLVLLISSELEDQVLKLVHPELFHVGSWCYLVFNILVALFLPPSRQLLPIFILALTDVLMLCGLFYAGGGVPSGIGSLLVVAVAIANILLRGRIGLVIAAAASLGLLYLTFFLSLSSPDATNHYVQAGGLGTLCFAAALVIQALVRRQEQTETLAEERAETVANQAALGLLRQDDVQGASLGRHSPMLMHCMKQWRLNPSLRPPTLKVVPDGPTVQPSFISLNREDDQHVLIFLEDISQIAQQAQQMKLAGLGRLTAGIAHEIRNPLGAISHAAQLLQESEELDAPDRRLTQIIQDQSKRMNLVIENVLQLSRRRQAEPQQLDLKEWLQRFVDEYPGRLRNDSQLHLQLGAGDIQTRMDPHQLNQVLSNLVQNGLRYSAQAHGRGQVWLSLARDPESDLPVLEVIDDGPGVPADKLNNLFEPFFTTESKGTGLGLYLSRELCESNQARIDYRNREEGGGCFRITFAHPRKLS